MRAAVVGASGVAIQDVPVPRPGQDQILVRLRAIGLNRADLGIASGHMHGAVGGPGAIPGLEGSGEIVECGPGVPAHITPGMRVMGAMGSAYAEYALADWARVNPVPATNMAWEVAATLPVALQTMHNAVVTHGQVREGGSIMILGASSGVGLMGLQIARLKGAKVIIGTSTNPEKRARLKEFGATHVVDTNDRGWVQQVLDATAGKGVESVVDQLSGAVTSQALHATAVLGRIVNVGRLAGMKAEFDFDTHAARRISYIGVTFRTRSNAEVREIVRLMREDLWSAVESGALALPLDRVFALDDVRDALAHMQANQHFGKIAMRVG